MGAEGVPLAQFRRRTGREQPIRRPSLALGHLLPSEQHPTKLERKGHQSVLAAFATHFQQQVVVVHITLPEPESFLDADTRVSEGAGQGERPPLVGGRRLVGDQPLQVFVGQRLDEALLNSLRPKTRGAGMWPSA